MAMIEETCGHRSPYHDRSLPLTIVLITVVMLVDRGADPTVALCSVAGLVAAVGRVTRG
ncbi:hypothetical protein [Actinoplanes sp. NBRC 103695]|uniref:hypothetical protein n=1 Tax=Actinoplanes sp. NBRC 103695 TaxID=3032202 RepID=UPI0025552E62|nr:hypothetical protein [Actinoplanes sp. NBRC 103695]